MTPGIMEKKKSDDDLPSGWVARQSRTRAGKTYYINMVTKTSQWQHPGTSHESAESSTSARKKEETKPQEVAQRRFVKAKRRLPQDKAKTDANSKPPTASIDVGKREVSSEKSKNVSLTTPQEPSTSQKRKDTKRKGSPTDSKGIESVTTPCTPTDDVAIVSKPAKPTDTPSAEPGRQTLRAKRLLTKTPESSTTQPVRPSSSRTPKPNTPVQTPVKIPKVASPFITPESLPRSSQIRKRPSPVVTRTEISSSKQQTNTAGFSLSLRSTPKPTSQNVAPSSTPHRDNREFTPQSTPGLSGPLQRTPKGNRSDTGPVGFETPSKGLALPDPSPFPTPSTPFNSQNALFSRTGSSSNSPFPSTPLQSTPIQNTAFPSPHIFGWVTPPGSSRSDSEMDMEVEEMGVELIADLNQVRKSVSSDDNTAQAEEMMQMKRNIHDLRSSGSQQIYLIVDTNVLISNLKFIGQLRDQKYPVYGYPNLVIPWIVMQELDRLKDGRSKNMANKTKFLARDAVNFVHGCLKAKHPRLNFQSPAEERKEDGHGLKIECNDDRILLCCIDWREKYKEATVALLTLDKNLRNKAMIIGIDCHSSQSLKEDLEENNSPKRKSFKKEEDHDTVLLKKMTDEIYCECKNGMKDPLCLVLETEMKKAYDDLWETIVMIKPPWSAYEALQCIKKHQTAVFIDILRRREHSDLVESLVKKFSPGADSTDLQVVKTMLQECRDLLSALKTGNTLYTRAMKKVFTLLNELQRIAKLVLGKQMRPGELSDLKQSIESSNGPTSPTSTPVKGGNSAEQDTGNTVDVKTPTVALNASTSSSLSKSQEKMEDLASRVMQIFQVAWENIMFCQKHLEANLPTSEALQRTNYVDFLAKIVKALVSVSEAYSKMLSLSREDEPSYRQSVLETLCSCLDAVATEARIQPWLSMEASWLEAYSETAESREVLSNGFMQLQGFITGYHSIWQQLLTPEEQARTAL